MVDAHIGDRSRAVVKLVDTSGNTTDRFDRTTGMRYSSSDPSKVTVVDDDAEPQDARLDFLALTEGQPVRVEVVFDGDPGDGVREITLVSEEIQVVAGDATGGEVLIVFNQV